MADIRKVAVIGAGVMGAGIAAHVANAGVPVVLLDIVPKGAADRDVIAKVAVEKMLKSEPAAFMSKAAAKLVTAGNIEDHLGLIADCDWIVEAVIERLDIKLALYSRIEAVRKDGSVVSSNTSTIPLSKLTEGLPERFAQDWDVFEEDLFLKILRAGGNEDTLAAEDRRDQIREGLPRACASFGDQRPAMLDDVGDRGCHGTLSLARLVVVNRTRQRTIVRKNGRGRGSQPQTYCSSG